MNESMVDELRALRARAYGPDADLHDDPEAWERLRELEDISRGQDGVGAASAPAPASEDVVPTPQEDASAPAASVDSEALPAEAVEPTGASRRQWSGKRIAVVLVASVATAVVVTAAVTGLIARRVQADVREVAVLGVDPAATVPEIFGGTECNGEDCEPSGAPEARVFTEFYGLSAFVVSGQFMGAAENDPCLMVTDTSQLDTEGNGFSGRIYTGCGAGEFPATTQFPVTRELPEELRDEFPVGSGLQFVLDGDEVIVLSDVR